MPPNEQSSVSTLSGRKVIKEDEKKSMQLEYIKDNPVLASTINILVTDKNNPQLGKNQKDALIKSARAATMFASLTTIQTQRIRDAELIKKHLTDLKLVENILISSILSPKDLVKAEISYSYQDSTSLPPTTAMAMLGVIRDHFKTGYKIEDKLSSILAEALFRSGSDPYMVLPETAMDQLINGDNGSISLEDYTEKAKGLISSSILQSNTGKQIKSMNSILNKRNGFMDILTDATVSQEARATEYKGKNGDKEITIDLTKDLGFTVTDNIELLKLPQVIKRVAERISNEAYYEYGDPDLDLSMEAWDLKENGSKDTVSQESNNTPYGFLPADAFMVGGRDTREGTNSEIVILNDTPKRPNIGHPTVMRWPAEAIFPIKIAGDKNKFAGFFGAIDESGNPVTMDLTDFYMRNMGSVSTYTGANGNNSNVIGNASLQKWGIGMDGEQLKHEQYLYAQKLYASLAEAKLLEEIRNGVYGEDIEINAKQEIFKIMFARSLSNKRTRLVFIPNTLLTYFSFHYDENGLGVSLIEMNKEIEAQRIAIDYAQSMANLKAAIPQYKIDITLDEVEQDAEEAVEMQLHNWVKSQRATNVFNIGNPGDMITNIILFGAKVNVEDHPNYPKAEFNVDSSTGNYQVPDTAWSEKLEERNHMGFGIPHEIIKSFTGTDFATTAVLDNLMLMKTATEYSNLYIPQLRQFIINYVLASGTMMKELADILKESVNELSDEDKKIPIKRRIKMFMDELVVSLPVADTKYNDTIKEQLENYAGIIDTIVDQCLGEEMSDSELLGEEADQIDRYKKYVKAYLLNDYIVRNNVVPAFTTLLTNPEEETNVFINNAIAKNTQMKAVLKNIKDLVAKAVGENEADGTVELDNTGNPIQQAIVEAGDTSDDINAFGTNKDYQSTQGKNDQGWDINSKPPEGSDASPTSRPD